MKLIPFDPAHIEQYTPSVWEDGLFDLDELRRVSKTWPGNAVTAMDDEGVVAIAAWSLDGSIAKVGMMLTDRIKAHPIYLMKQIKEGIELLHDYEIRVTCRSDYPTGLRWLGRFGFKPTGDVEQVKGIDLLEYAL